MAGSTAPMLKPGWWTLCEMLTISSAAQSRFGADEFVNKKLIRVAG